MTSPPPGQFAAIERLLADRIGLDIASVGSNLIQRGVENRMRHLGVGQLVNYERILVGPTDEIQALIEEVVIPESWFFRDDRPFTAFRDLVRANWLADPARPRLSVLCLPCASGEEPYSVVMTLLELGLPRNRFEVVAIDVSERSILRATRGIYGAHAFRGVADQLRDRYFDYTATPGRYLLKAAIRAAVRFERGNLLDSNLLADHGGFDVIFCRNLLIYFDDPARIRAFQNLDRLATDDGYLFLGHADRPDPNLTTRFVPHADKGSFLYRKRAGARESSSAESTTPAGPSARRPSSPTSRPRVASRANETTRLAPPPPPPTSERRTRPDSAVAGLPASPPTPRGDRDDVLARALKLADGGKYDEATDLVQGQLGRGMLDAPAHYLLGIIHQAAGDRTRAEAELLKAVYLEPDHDEALLDLALLARRRGDMAAEAHFRRRAERVRARKGQS